MSNEEHYFENLIFLGKDCKGEPNKSALSKDVQEAIETCYRYLIYNKDSIMYKLNEDLSEPQESEEISREEIAALLARESEEQA